MIVRTLLASTLLCLSTIAHAQNASPTSVPADSSHHHQTTHTVDPGAETPVPATRAVAIMTATEGNSAHGVIAFTEGSEGGVDISAEISGLEPGVHAFHVHVYGDCTAANATSAGTHFNFAGSALNPPADIDRITGNLGELQADEAGSATLSVNIPMANLQGPYSIIGRSVIIHEHGNDHDHPPIGAAGGRVACGVIGIDSAE